MGRRAAVLVLLASCVVGVHPATSTSTTPPTPQPVQHVHPVRVAQDTSPRASRTYARTALAARGLGARQFACLHALWTRESHWNHKAHNKSSGAYGIPQALPAGKMRSAGHDWRTNPRTQIRWGLRYISKRYGTPCKARAHQLRKGWY